MSKKTSDAAQPEPQPEPQDEGSGSRWEPAPSDAEANAPTEQVPAPDQQTNDVPPMYAAAPVTPVDQAPSNATFASIKALSKGAKGALAGAAAVLVLGSGVTGFAIGQAGDDGHQRIDARFGQTGFDRDGDGRGMPGQQGQLPGQAPQQGDGSES